MPASGLENGHAVIHKVECFLGFGNAGRGFHRDTEAYLITVGYAAVNSSGAVF